MTIKSKAYKTNTDQSQINANEPSVKLIAAYIHI